MIKVIYSMRGTYGYDSGMREPPVVGSIIAETRQEADMISEHLGDTFGSALKISIVGKSGVIPTDSLLHAFTTHEHAWTGALERLVELETKQYHRLYWEEELKAMRNAYAVVRGEKGHD